MTIHPIILSGGHGTRLWPASRPWRPKQFLPLLGPRSMFQTTVERMAVASDGTPAVVVAGEHHAEEIDRQLKALGRNAVLLIEPVGRDSAPAIAAAAAWVAREDPDGVCVTVASDHHLPDTRGFRTAVLAAVEGARSGGVVTFGVTPSSPSQAYGYICAGDPIEPDGLVRRVRAFVEKPNAALARQYVQEGYFWNSGNFVFQAATLMDELDLHAPEVSRVARSAVAELRSRPGVHRLGAVFATAPKISIDYAVMEKTRHALVVPLDLAWSDLGAWDAVLAAAVKDPQGNLAVGDVLLANAKDCLVRSTTDQTVAVLDLSNVGVVVEGDAILVCDLASSQNVKQVVDQLKREGRGATELGSQDADPEIRLAELARTLGAWLRTSALPLWWALGADHEQGGFRDVLHLDGAPSRLPMRARVQARQVYVFALAGTMGWPGPWRQAVGHGLDHFKARFRLPAGGFRTRVGVDGAPDDDTVMLYDQAFALLALAWSQGAGVGGDHEPEATALLDGPIQGRAGAAGGYREASIERAWQSNAHMHLLEACLAWEAVSHAAVWREQADRLAELALTRFIDPGSHVLREVFDADWSPAPGPAGRLVEPGHQFEWAWLLERWGRSRHRPDAQRTAERLFELATAHGVDAARGAVVNAISDTFEVIDAGARLWPQTERLKAALLLSERAEAQDRRRLLKDAAEAASTLLRYLDTPVRGLWRDVLLADDSFVQQPAPASSLYHIACAIHALETWTSDGARPASGPG